MLTLRVTRRLLRVLLRPPLVDVLLLLLTRQALALAQLRTRRTHVIAYAGGYFEIFETFVRFSLQLPASAQDRLRHGLDEHLRTVTQRE